MDPILLTLLALGGIIFAYIIANALRTPCAQCGAKGTVHWRYTKKNGGPDLRHNDNAQVCSACGWASDAPTPEQVYMQVEQARRRAEIQQVEKEQREAREVEVLPAKCLTLLLKYVALGDRRVGDGEKLHIEKIVRGAFPGKLTEVELRSFVEHSAPEYHNLSLYVQPFLPLSEEARRDMLAVITSVAASDGKVTKSERERLTAIQAALGITDDITL